MIIQFLSLGLIQLLAVASPGPDFAMVMKNTISYSRRTGLYTALGISCGVMFHLTYCLLGLAIIISKSLVLFSIIKYLGAAYLIYIGIKCLLSKQPSKSPTIHHHKQGISALRAFQQGVLCNILNPKASLFFLGLFTLVIKPDTPRFIQIAYGAEIIIITFCWFSSLVLMITHPKMLGKIHKLQHVITKLMGAFLVAFGAKLALMTQQ